MGALYNLWQMEYISHVTKLPLRFISICWRKAVTHSCQTVAFKPGTHWPKFLKIDYLNVCICVYVRVCVHVCACMLVSPPLRLLITSDMIWTPYDYD